MKFCHLKPNKFQLLLHDYITKNNKHLYLLSTSLSFYFADIKVFIVIFIKKFAKDAYYNLLMLGIQSPVGILKIYPTHSRAQPHIPAHTHAYPNTPTHTYPHIPATHAHSRMPMHDNSDMCNMLKAMFKKHLRKKEEERRRKQELEFAE